MATFLRQRTSIQVGSIDPALMTTYWDSTGAAIGLLATEAVARVRAFLNGLAADMPPGTTPTYNLLLDEIEETTGQIVNQVTATAPAAITFTGSSDLLPPQTQGLVRLQTASFIAGRRLQGRIFIPLQKETNNDTDGKPTAAYLVRLNNAAALLGTTVVTAMNQRVWSRPQPGRAGLSAPVVARSAATQWAVLKSRR